MGTEFSKLSPCVGANSTQHHVQREIKSELKSPIIRNRKKQEQVNEETEKKNELKEEEPEKKITCNNKDNNNNNNEDTKRQYKSQPKQIKLGTSISMDSYALNLPEPMSVANMAQAKSCSISLSPKHRHQLNQKRKSSLLIRRTKKDFALPFRINAICTLFAQYMIENDLTDNNDLDLFAIEITYSQFNIVLNNHQIEISPDMIAVLIWELLDINNMISNELKTIGLEKDNLHNNPMKERSFHQKQFKLISKCKVTYKMIKHLMEQLNTNNIISSWDKIAEAKHLSYKKRNFVIWHKIFKNCLGKTAFNVENDYLYGVLKEEDMNNMNKIIEMLSTLQTHWNHRIQIMKYIDNELAELQSNESNTNHKTNEMFSHIDNDTFTSLLNGWSIQLTDDRSAVSWTAIALLPTVLSSLLLCIQFPVILFDQTNIMNPMFHGLFILIKNKRMKDLADDAYESFIQIIDIFTEIATDLQDYELLKMIIQILEQHSNQNTEKHFKVREACIGAVGFVLFGADNEDVADTPMQAINENEDDIKQIDDQIIKQKYAAKLSNKMQRKYLLQNQQFVESLGQILKNAITDKNELCRKKSFQLLEKLDNQSKEKENILDNVSKKWDYIVNKKYNSFKRLQLRKKEKKKSWKRNQKKEKKNKKKKKIIVIDAQSNHI